MATERDTPTERHDSDGPSVKQLLHWATGDRKAEGEALADAAGPQVADEAGETAVKQAHGDLGVSDADDPDDGDVAGVEDARAVGRDQG